VSATATAYWSWRSEKACGRGFTIGGDYRIAPRRGLRESWEQALLDNTERAVARGVFGSPSFFVGDELFFGKDRLREVEEEIEAQKAR